MKINLNRKLAKYRLIKRYKYLLQVDKIMEEFITKTILDGGSDEFVAASRNQLLALQRDISSKEKLVDFLKTLK